MEIKSNGIKLHSQSVYYNYFHLSSDLTGMSCRPKIENIAFDFVWFFCFWRTIHAHVARNGQQMDIQRKSFSAGRRRSTAVRGVVRFPGRGGEPVES
jgi:hypothetical protein